MVEGQGENMMKERDKANEVTQCRNKTRQKEKSKNKSCKDLTERSRLFCSWARRSGRYIARLYLSVRLDAFISRRRRRSSSSSRSRIRASMRRHGILVMTFSQEQGRGWGRRGFDVPFGQHR